MTHGARHVVAQELGPAALKAEAEALTMLRLREGELERATQSANAAIAEDLDEAV